MATTIPEHDGRRPDALRLSFSGSDDATDQVYQVGDEVYVLCKGKVTSVAYKENSFGVLRRVQSVSVDHALPADEVTSERIEQEAKRRDDLAAGQESLDDAIDDDIDEPATADE